VLVAVGVVLAVVTLRGHMPDLAATLAALRGASPAWVMVAAALQVLSMTAFAEQQRQLLAAFGVRMTASVSLAISYARSAMTTALPGGSAVSAGYAFRQFRSHGASQPIAAAVMLLSGVASAVGLALLYAVDALAWMSRSTQVVAITGTAVIIVIVVASVWRGPQPPTSALAPAAGRGGSLADRRRETIALARTVPAGQWVRVTALAALNWLTDLACLMAALQAIGLSVPVRTVATAYFAVQLVRQVPLTPGGIGVIEASLMLALTAAGVAAAPAAAAVLVYRLLSCWTILPIGLICWTAQKAPSPSTVRYGLT
jgi:uncharacterized membrane protein YbhN (UPF0104 family)